MDIEDILNVTINQASKGRELWIDIINDYNMRENDYAILIPSADAKYSYYTLLYLEQFMTINKVNKVVLLTYDERIQKVLHLFIKNEKVQIKNFTRNKAEFLMKFYCLYMFTDRLIIASLDEPYGRSGRRLLHKKGLTIEELFAVGVYHIKNYKKAEPVVYHGADEEINSFLKKAKGCEKYGI